ncbi:putative F-box domain-containing protein [Helianthus annuus]|nr:putative F-box domain-containing protein [Helianthus annuus]KAJ0814823.1 putative F-box domain-containing protein [Helianthus annuus]KAJ0828044.1 putative F-box domain-containing protein [Helianthus annuus]
MSDNIPFEIQVEILKRLPVKLLIQFRSVSKTWRSLIDGSSFIAEYARQHTETQHILLRYRDYQPNYELKYVSIVDDETFPGNKVSLTHPVLRQMCKHYSIIGYSHGLFCFYHEAQVVCNGHSFGTGRAVLWNPSIRKSVDVVVSNVADGVTYETVLNFGICRETNDPKIVKITHLIWWGNIESASHIPWQVEVYTLSTGAWRSLSGNLPRKRIHFDFCPEFDNCYSVDMGGVLYWLAVDWDSMDGESCNLIISFDMTSEEFGEVNLPNGLAHSPDGHCLRVSKLGESLVVFEEADQMVYNVWMMEGDVSKSFTKRFTLNVNALHHPQAILGFRKSGEPIIEMLENENDFELGRVAVYEPHSKHMYNLGFDGMSSTFFVYPYMETLLLLDQPNLTIHNEPETLNVQDDLVA